jgi:hypothetical protein
MGNRNAWAFVLLAALAAAPVRGEVPRLLGQALEDVARDSGRWAYTETTVVKTDKGRILRSTVFRIDPSKPYAEQTVPIKIDGKPPSERELRKYRGQGEKRAEARENGKPTRERPSLGSLVLLDGATVFAENAATVTYLVPLRKDGNDRFPPDRFRVLARVDRRTAALEHVSVDLLSPIHFKVILKEKSGDLQVEFGAAEPGRGRLMTAFRGAGSFSLLFFSMNGNIEVTRTDIRHVTPYDERLGVRIGPLKALDF